MKTLTERPDPEAWTADLVPPDGRLPDRAALRKALLTAGQQFSIRGMEAVVEGSLERQGDLVALRAPGLDEPLVLAPLTHKVQWARSKKRVAAATEAERGAYTRLLAAWDGAPLRVSITGPVRVPRKSMDAPAEAAGSNEAEVHGELPPAEPVALKLTLEVRTFRLLGSLPAPAAP